MSGSGRKGDDPRNAQVISLLNQLGERMIRSERERDSIRAEIESTRELLMSLEGKADQAERIFLTIQDKISKQEGLERSMIQRQDDLERLYRENAERLIRAEALTGKIEEAIALQNRLARRLEKTAQDKARILTKIERIEESVQKTREAVSANAMIVADGGFRQNSDEAAGPLWKRPIRQQLASASQVVVWILLGGLVVNQLVAHWPAKDVAVQNIVVADSDARGEDRQYVSALEPVAAMRQEQQPETPPEQTATVAPDKNELSSYTDEELVAAMETDPDGLAAVLNRIEPVAGEAADAVQEAAPPKTPEAVVDASFTPAAEPAPANIEDFVKSEVGAAKSLKERITPDGKLPSVIKKVEDKAFEGLPEAQHDLAAIYTAGHGGVAVDYIRAAQWFREAAANGVANARYNLGVLYHQGLGVERNVNKAIQWYRAAAEIGHPEAQYNLGIAAIEGIGTQYDPRQAAGFFEKAARGGVAEAAYNLGLIHENGLLGDPDMNEAVFWYKTAADKDNPEALTAFTQVIKALGLKNGDVERIMKEYKAVYKLDDAAGAVSQKQTNANIPPPPVPGSVAPRTETAVASALTADDQVTPSGDPVDLTDMIPPLSKEESRSLLASIDGHNANQAMVAQVQEQLIRLGLYPGPADGQGGPQTEDAIRSYQSQHKLEITGRPSEDLLVHMLASELNAASGMMEEENGSREE